MLCKICAANSGPFARARLLGKYDIQYFQCPVCGFIQTEEPYWLDEAYSEAITGSDLGLLGRNVSTAKISRVIIAAFFAPDAKFVDYGGGYGIFVRLMRDYGFDFYRYDKSCQNLFAKDFEADLHSAGQYKLLTAFEVFEHLTDPLGEIDRMKGFSRNILFSTRLVPRPTPNLDEWWYYGLDHGQHISFFTQKAIAIIADKLGLNLYSNGSWLHLLTEKTLSSFLFNLVSRYRVSQVLGPLIRRRSLLSDDYYRVTGKHLNRVDHNRI